VHLEIHFQTLTNIYKGCSANESSTHYAIVHSFVGIQHVQSCPPIVSIHVTVENGHGRTHIKRPYWNCSAVVVVWCCCHGARSTRFGHLAGAHPWRIRRGVGLSWNWDGQSALLRPFALTIVPFSKFAILPLVGAETKKSSGTSNRTVWSNSKNGGGAILCMRPSLCVCIEVMIFVSVDIHSNYVR
jgi:hypothetical protein